MWGFVVLVAAPMIYSGAHQLAADGTIRLAQAVTTPPTVTAPSAGPSSAVTSTVTACMMSCSSQSANCYSSCLIPSPRGYLSRNPDPQLNG